MGLAATATLCAQSPAVVYLRSSAAPPWGVTSNEVDMNDVFGAGNWIAQRYETADPNSLLSSATSFLYLEGGDNNANALQTFLSNNAASIAAWVNGGGRLFLNAAPNQGSGMDYGFGIHLNFDPDGYTTAANSATAVNATHPIFNQPTQPVGTSFSGGDSFSHAYLTGSGLSPILQDDQGRTVLAEMQVGNGLVLFGGMTVDIFQQPWPQTHNLRTNILWYLATHQVTNTAQGSN